MVSLRLDSAARARRAARLAGAVILAAACARRETAANAGAAGDTTTAARAALAVRRQYHAADAAAAGAWTWPAPDGRIFVLVDLQSTVAGIVQARADLWLVDDSEPARVGRSEPLPAAAEIGAYAFEDLTGDGLPDLLGYVADSSGESYPVFIPGARGAMSEEIAVAAPRWRFSTAEDHAPLLVRGERFACALQLWAVEPAPDRRSEGWRWLPMLRDGQLGAPQAAAPSCGGELPARRGYSKGPSNLRIRM